MSENEGELANIDVMGNHMVVVTDSRIKIYDLSRREYRIVSMARRFEDK
jgi:hypothetical protein